MGTRGSLLARAQSGMIALQLEASCPGLAVETIIIQTSGDRITDTPLHEAGGKGLFTKEIEQALLDGRIDLAVHSYKDVPVTQPLVDVSDLVICAVPEREDPRDVLASSNAATLESLPPGARVGTGSLRRGCQIAAARPDLKVVPIRGNIDTRLRKQREGEFDAVVLALAGLRRTGLFDGEHMTIVSAETILPAAAQGALALQCRRDNATALRLLARVHHPATAACVDIERELVAKLRGDCHSPIAALAVIDNGEMTFSARVGARSGLGPIIAAQATGPAREAKQLLETVYADLAAQGVLALLHPHG